MRAPPSAKTVENKTAAGESTKILSADWRMQNGRATRDGGYLWAALSSGGNIKRATRTTATVGIRARGGAFYVKFIDRGTASMPARRLVTITESDAAEYTGLAVRWLLSGDRRQRWS